MNTNLISTKIFTLATYSQGDINSEKLALVLPGRLDTKDYTHMRAHVEYLASRGFFALSFDPPGIWESPGDISLYTTLNYLKAVDELIEHFGNKPTLLLGHSRGASMTIMAGLRNPFVNAFVSVFPSIRVDGSWERSDSAKWKEQGYLISLRDLPPGGGPKVKEFKLPYSFYEDQLQFGSVTDDLEKSTKPKLFFLGKKDSIVPPQVIRDLYNVSGDPKQLYELDSEHDYRLKKNLLDEVNYVIGDFLDKYNII